MIYYASIVYFNFAIDGRPPFPDLLNQILKFSQLPFILPEVELHKKQVYPEFCRHQLSTC